MIENRLVRFNEGDILFSSGDDSREMYIIRSGKVKVLISKEGKNIPLVELGRGHYVGEMSFLTGVRRSATVVADSGVVASKIDPSILDEDDMGISAWAVSIARVLVRRIRTTTELLGDFLLSDSPVEQTKRRRIDDSPVLEIDCSNKMHPQKIFLKGQFTEQDIDRVKSRMREVRLMRIFPVVLDFSDVMDIDQAGINFLFSLTRSADVAEGKLKIQNLQLIRDKVLAIKGLRDMVSVTAIPTRTLEQDEVLIEQGAPGNFMYVVKSGSFSISRKTGKGDVKLAVAEAGDVIGEMALLKEGLRSADVVSSRTSAVHVIDVMEFYNNIYNVPGWFHELIKGLVQRLRNTNEMLEQICNDRIETEKTRSWDTPFSVTLDSSQPGRFHLKGVLSLANLQYFVPLVNLEIKRGTPKISMDLTEAEYIERESVASLLSLYTQLKNRGIPLEIRGPGKVMSNILNQFRMNGNTPEDSWERAD